MKSRQERYEFRKVRVRSKITGTEVRPRLSVYRSLKHVYAQIIDDVQGRTLVAASTNEKAAPKLTGVSAAEAVGERIGKRATEKGIKAVVFDRGARPYHGQVKSVAEGARKSGLQL
jgi:large subunit ribosomal protein L18